MQLELLLLKGSDIGKKSFEHFSALPLNKAEYIKWIEENMNLQNGILLLVEENDYAPLVRRVIWSNFEDFIEAKTYFGVTDLLARYPERYIDSLKDPDELNISEQEKELFGLLGAKYDELLMVKTKLNDIPTTAVCIVEVDEKGQETIKPVAVLVNALIFPMLTPPEKILPGKDAGV